MKTYLVDLVREVAAAFAGAAAAVLAVTDADLTSGDTWQAGLLAGAVAALAKLSTRLKGDPNSGSFTK